MKKFLYLAYGSNLLIERLEHRVKLFGPITKVKTVKVPNYKLVFNVLGGFANIIPIHGSFVEGVVYSLNAKQIRLLDWYEGFYEKKLITHEGDRLITYIGQPKFLVPENKIPPSLEYINCIIDGAKDNKLKDTYNKLVLYKKDILKLKKSKHRLWK